MVVPAVRTVKLLFHLSIPSKKMGGSVTLSANAFGDVIHIDHRREQASSL